MCTPYGGRSCHTWPGSRTAGAAGVQGQATCRLAEPGYLVLRVAAESPEKVCLFGCPSTMRGKPPVGHHDHLRNGHAWTSCRDLCGPCEGSSQPRYRRGSPRPVFDWQRAASVQQQHYGAAALPVDPEALVLFVHVGQLYSSMHAHEFCASA